MKRLLLPAALACGLHALVLSAKVEWTGEASFPPAAPPIRLSLSYRTPEPEPTPAPPLIESPPKAPPSPAPKEVEEPKKDPGPERKQPLPKNRPSRKLHKEPPPREMRDAVEPLETASFPEEQTHASSTVETPASARPPAPTPPSPSETRGASPPPPSAGAEPAPPSRQAAPLYLENPPPRYPPAARRRGYEGTVRVEAFVDREGRVRDLRLLQSSGHAMLDRAAMGAVKGWRFEPARRGEEKVEMWVTVPLTFRLKD